MHSLVIIKYCNILQHILLCFISGLVMPPLATHCLRLPKKSFQPLNFLNNFLNDSCMPIKPWAFSMVRYALLAYCDPRSECTIRPTSFACVRKLMLQPTSFWKTNQSQSPDTDSLPASRYTLYRKNRFDPVWQHQIADSICSRIPVVGDYCPLLPCISSGSLPLVSQLPAL